MFAVIYRAYIKPGREREYQKLWHTIANFFIKNRGALGSCLHKTEDGFWLAYSRWPDKMTRDVPYATAFHKDQDRTCEKIRHVGIINDWLQLSGGKRHEA